MTKGKFIVFEGLDGSGKGTQVEKLAGWFREQGEKVYVTAEPQHEAEIGKYIRQMMRGEKEMKDPATMAALFLADRLDHCINPEYGVKKYLDEGYIVISDRYYYSNIAYQGKDVYPGWIIQMNLDAPGMLHPDVTIFLDVGPTEAFNRVHDRGEKIEVYESNEDVMLKTRAQFYEAFNALNMPVNKEKSPANIHFIDGSKDPLKVFAMIRDIFIEPKVCGCCGQELPK